MTFWLSLSLKKNLVSRYMYMYVFENNLCKLSVIGNYPTSYTLYLKIIMLLYLDLVARIDK